MLDRLETISANLKTTDDLLALSLDDLTADTTAFRTRNGEGPSILWLVEHMMGSRDNMLRLLRAPLPDGATKTTADPSGLLRSWTEQADHLHKTLEHCTAGVLDAEAKGGPHGETTVFGLINFLAFHEAYHFGAVGVTRKVLGLPEVAQLARDEQRRHSAHEVVHEEAAVAS
jgi:hypothetical protein